MKKLLVASIAAATLWSAPGVAADPSSGVYWQVEGIYALKDPNAGFNNGFGGAIQGHDVGPGEGFWANGHVGYLLPSGWDWRLGGGYVKLGMGAGNGVGPSNEMFVTGARMYNVDADIGFVFGGPTQLRPFIGARYLNWNQKADIPASGPPACCFLNSDFSGVGPLAGLDLKSPISFLPNVSFVAGGEVAALFGSIDYQRGSFANPNANGNLSRTVWNYGAYAGFDWQVTRNASVGIKYRFMAMHGTAFENPQLQSGIPPTGTPTNLLQGPSISLAVKY
jgi:opacity protein-like surface antigen